MTTKIGTSQGSETTLTNNKIKNIIKVIKSLENRGILLKRANRKNNSQKGGFLNFLAPLTRVALPLMKNVFEPLAKSALLPLGLTVVVSPTDAAIQKKLFGSDMGPSDLAKQNNINIFK